MRSATSAYMVDFRRPPKPVTTAETPGRIPRIARLLALAHGIETRIRSGDLKNLAHAAKIMGLTRARLTQVCNLLLLSPEIQEAILILPPVAKGRDRVTERSLRQIVAEPTWQRQTGLWKLHLTRLGTLAAERRSSSGLAQPGRAAGRREPPDLGTRPSRGRRYDARP